MLLAARPSQAATSSISGTARPGRPASASHTWGGQARPGQARPPCHLQPGWAAAASSIPGTAWTEPKIVGFAMYYYTYDPWIGKLLYLEDFYVMDDYRGWGIGTELLKKLSQIALDTNCGCMHFLVVVWNKPSIEYYMRRGASDLSTEEGWHLFRFDKENLLRMAMGE
ncbi:spermidine/spermine N(1)-acetyltransferase-like protein 1 isoform X2 [Hemicordylus capensis]|uniref:spermidine/spermine N(1)-acetyltransferase-like protein 1 isoform X2 n=1 Tax=Hemicordylus capensis TaxID=884348 RepID=UPI002302542E|nr:spermidine/spermine N(1)-acetyltransferase-like protein 1 isoform X2 [Hemicordylus capensis]